MNRYQGDVIVMNRAPPDQNEWWNGINTRTLEQGYFPGNYVKPLVQGKLLLVLLELEFI